MKNVLFKRKIIPIEVNFLLWEELDFEFGQFEFFCKVPSRNFDGGGEEQAELFERRLLRKQ